MTKEIKSSLQNIPTAAHRCRQGGGVGCDLVWAEFSPFPSWHTKYAIEKISDVVKETLAKNVKYLIYNLQNKHSATQWCWQGGGVGREAKLSLFTFPIMAQKVCYWKNYEM